MTSLAEDCLDHPKIAWIKQFLAERLGSNFCVSVDRGFFRLYRRDSHRYVKIGGINEEFYLPGYDPPHAVWDSRALPFLRLDSVLIPAPGLRSTDKPLVNMSSDSATLNYDVIGLSFWALNRLEEYGAVVKDKFDRFPASASHAARHGYIDRPIVDEWIEIVRQIIARVWSPSCCVIPNFSVCVSHDIDRPGRYALQPLPTLLRRSLSDLVARTEVRKLIRIPQIYISGRRQLHADDPWNTFDWLMSTSEGLGIKSTFYLICGTSNRKYDAHYACSDPSITQLIKKIAARHHKIGLHPSFECYKNQGLMRSESECLLRACKNLDIDVAEWGVRMHYLRWSVENTPGFIESIGASYDSTLTYPDKAGFRCGTCHGYSFFSISENRTLRLRIKPLVAMESAVLFNERGESERHVQAFASLKALKDRCRSVRGQFTMLWHNSELETEDLKELYRNVLSC